MIHFERVKWRNFLSTGNIFTEVQLDRSPTTLIIGENGAGKSTILDALCFGLFGKPFRPINKGQLINSVNERDAEVQVEFRVQKKQIRVVRGIKPNKFEIYVNDKMINQDASARDYQKYLEQQILKMNYRSFTQVVILGSSTFVPFMQLPAKQRREVVEDILDIKIFSLMNFLLKHKVKEVVDQIRDVEYEIDITRDKIELQENYIKDLQKNKTDVINNAKQKLDENNGVIVERKDRIRELQIEIDFAYDLDGDLDKLQKKLKKLHQTEAALDNRLKENERYKEFFEQNENCPTCTQTIDDNIKKEKVAEKSGKLEEINTALGELNGLIEEQASSITEIQTHLKERRQKEVEIAQLKSSTDELESANRKLVKDIESYEQGELSDDDKAKLTSLKERLKLNRERKHKLQEDRTYVETAKTLLQDSGIKTKIIKQYLPVMNKLVNQYLCNMDFFVNLQIDENFNETIKSRGRDDFSYASFSEGEKMRIDLALLFTWRAIAKMKNSVSTNLLILDEVFDSSLDGTGTDDFMKILDTFGDQNVFVISHKTDALIDKFRSVVRFEKQKNFSYMAK